MSAVRLPAGEARAALVTLATLAGFLVFADAGLGPGPLGACAGVAAFCAVIVVPACRPGGGYRWSFLPTLIALPFLCACSYGHGWRPALDAILFVVFASVAAAAPRFAPERWRPFYLPSMLLLFVAPYALGYLVAEFGSADPDQWRSLSPYEQAKLWVDGDAKVGFAVVLMLAWTILALWATSRRRG